MEKAENEGVRIQKYMAMCSVASRRKCEEIIARGRVCINGTKIESPGAKVYEGDIVTLDGKPLSLEEKKVYILLNKPEGCVTTVKDQFGRKTVMDFVNESERLFPVGRLDYATSGALILTNDGEFSNILTHPSKEKVKTYIAFVDGNPSPEDIQKLREGVYIDGRKTAPARVESLKKTAKGTLLEIKIHEGRNRQVRKMCQSIGRKVIKLKRTAIGNVTLGSLKEGEYRYLTEEEIKGLIG